MVFDILLYTLATVSVLAIVGSHRSGRKAPATLPAPALPEIDVPDYDQLFRAALDLDLPEDPCAIDVVVAEMPPITVPAGVHGADLTTDEDAALVDAAAEAIAQYWAAPLVLLIEYSSRDELRGHCNACGIQPFDRIGGRRKFWPELRMRAALEGAGYVVQRAA